MRSRHTQYNVSQVMLYTYNPCFTSVLKPITHQRHHNTKTEKLTNDRITKNAETVAKMNMISALLT